jgi:hypothetical protein
MKMSAKSKGLWSLLWRTATSPMYPTSSSHGIAVLQQLHGMTHSGSSTWKIFAPTDVMGHCLTMLTQPSAHVMDKLMLSFILQPFLHKDGDG